MTELISYQKQRKIIATAKRYCAEHKIIDMICRFDVALVSEKINEKPTILIIEKCIYRKFAMIEFIQRLGTSIILGSAFWFLFILLPPIYFSGVLLGILFAIIFFEWRQLFNIKVFSFWLILPFYPILPFALLIYMNQHPLYHSLLLELFLLGRRV